MRLYSLAGQPIPRKNPFVGGLGGGPRETTAEQVFGGNLWELDTLDSLGEPWPVAYRGLQVGCTLRD